MRMLLSVISVLQAMTSSMGSDVSNTCASSEQREMMIHEGAGLDVTLFLQGELHVSTSTLASRTAHSSRDALISPEATARAQSLKPVAWLHIPKAGTSFINVLYRNPTLCPNTLDDARLEHATNRACQNLATDEYSRWDACPGGWSSPEVNGILHVSIGHLNEANVDHFVATVRQLEQRIIPEYSDQLGDHQQGVGLDEFGRLKDLAKGLQGCVVKLFAGLETEMFCGLTNVPLPTEEEVTRAVQRLRDGPRMPEDNEKTHLGASTTTPEPHDFLALENFADVVIVMGITFIFLITRCYV